MTCYNVCTIKMYICRRGSGQGYPLLSGGGVCGGGCAPLQKPFILCLAMVHFGELWALVLILI